MKLTLDKNSADDLELSKKDEVIEMMTGILRKLTYIQYIPDVHDAGITFDADGGQEITRQERELLLQLWSDEITQMLSS